MFSFSSFFIEQGYVEDTRHEEKQKMTQDS